MVCVRCGNRFNDDIPVRNTESYGGPNYYACPHCGKLYQYQMKMSIRPVSDDEYAAKKEEDDWCNNIVRDEDYKKS